MYSCTKCGEQYYGKHDRCAKCGEPMENAVFSDLKPTGAVPEVQQPDIRYQQLKPTPASQNPIEYYSPYGVQQAAVNANGVKWCRYCNRYVTPVKQQPMQMSWFAIVIFSILTGGLFLFFYLIARAFTSGIGKARRCPICNAKM